ncbi:MAG TPA: hypothetical protein VIN77_10390 [Aurantimonas sp.]|uniref:Uncharacterized protein n=1 Tax=Aurantimonas marianensis TaxID=2920428 RepID=A0A9X2HCY2_9HYPH|nr:hypothetical protein [Aurantimonas marianensis]MCP3056177.1 hypothetical protein [Aurantimonas marianensis]
MSELKRIVIEDYPAGRLPADVRQGIDPSHRVRVTVEDGQGELAQTSEKLPKYLRYWGIAAHKNTSIAEAVTRIRKLRDEWD